MSAEGGASLQMAQPQSQHAIPGPPYAPTTALLGGIPTPSVDDPICASLLLLYAAAAATNMAIFQANRRRHHKFPFSALLFGFCMARITTLSVRIAWASRPSSVDLTIAATILVQAGVLLLFLLNLVLAQRLLRSYRSRLGWSRPASWAFYLVYFCVLAMLVMVVTAAVDSFFTLAPRTHRIDRDIQLFVGTSLAALAFLPIPITLLAVLLAPPRSRPEEFGHGRHHTKLVLILSTSALLTLGAGFRVAVTYTAPRPAADPAWYQSRPCFYCFNFVVELLVVYAYAVSRFDKRFHVPDGSSAPGHYSGVRKVVGGGGGKGVGEGDGAGGLALDEWKVKQEREVFGNEGGGVMTILS